MQHEYNVKYYYTKREIEIIKKRILSLETRNIKLQGTMNKKSEKIANLQRQINEMECEKSIAAKADIKVVDQKEKEW